jgi:hypothetical protein
VVPNFGIRFGFKVISGGENRPGGGDRMGDAWFAGISICVSWIQGCAKKLAAGLDFSPAARPITQQISAYG